jgi:hypothetical protein
MTVVYKKILLAQNFFMFRLLDLVVDMADIQPAIEQAKAVQKQAEQQQYNNAALFEQQGQFMFHMR